jgi:hypothetical protein
MKKILTGIWKVFGIVLLIWFLYWFVKVRILNQYGMVSDVIRLTIGTCALIVYGIITIIYLLIKSKKAKKIK